VSRFYLTTAIDYVNSAPHLGTAYEKVCADVIVRYKRLAGAETFFLMGNDEHSQNVYKRAVEQGFLAMQFNFVVSTNERAVRLWERLGFSVVGRLPGAFRHRRLGYVDALVMFKALATGEARETVYHPPP